MAKVLIVYDSRTGHTEAMARAIADGAGAVRNVVVDLRKLGEPFSIELLDQADAIIIGSPTHYAYVTSELRAFLEAAKHLKNAGHLKLEGKIGVAFGSYGIKRTYLGGNWALQMLRDEMKELGIKMESPLLSSLGDPNEEQ